MIEKRTQIPELYYIKHFSDSLKNTGFDYGNKLFEKTLSPVMFKGKKLRYFLPLLQQNTVWMIDSVLPIRNWWNYTVDKYYNNHNN